MELCCGLSAIAIAAVIEFPPQPSRVVNRQNVKIIGIPFYAVQQKIKLLDSNDSGWYVK
jgi:hypothetical protein